MLWYGGSIAEAVALSKQKNAIFVVFVEGGSDDESSAEMLAALGDAEVSKRLNDQSQFLAVKLSSGSQHYTHFAQIYQFVPVPSLFFIGQNGTPLEVVCSGVQPDRLVDRIDRIVQEHNKGKTPGLPTPSTSGANLAAQSQAFIQSESQAKPPAAEANPSASEANPPALMGNPSASEAKPSASEVKPSAPEATSPASESNPSIPAANEAASCHVEKKRVEIREPEAEASTSGPTAAKQAKTVEYDVVCDGDICMRRPKSGAGPSQARTPDGPSTEQLVQEASPPEQPSGTMEERMERAKELIESKKQEKEAVEKELERQRELERRASGQGVAELRRWQADQELKALAEERRREKAESNLARQRILEQIAQDRAERKARAAEMSAAAAPAAPVQAPAGGSPSGEGGSVSPHARIQFKMADGSSHAAQFDADSTLTELQQYVASNLQGSPGEFSLWTAFPRRELSPALQGSSSLRELGLAPSAALLVLPASGAAQSGASGPAALPDTVARLYAFLAGILMGFIVEPVQGAYAWLRQQLFPAPPRPPRAPTAEPLPTRPSAPGLRHRPQSNVHRLNGDRSSDDENNTWNGNSTQQM